MPYGEARQGTYVLHFAGSGEEALQLLIHGIEPQLIVILSDINMPGMDGRRAEGANLKELAQSYNVRIATISRLSSRAAE